MCISSTHPPMISAEPAIAALCAVVGVQCHAMYFITVIKEKVIKPSVINLMKALWQVKMKCKV